MSFEEDDTVILHDEHSEYDGQVGTVSQKLETMFGDANYVISFEEGQEQGVPEDSLEPAEDAAAEDAEEGTEADADEDTEDLEEA